MLKVEKLKSGKVGKWLSWKVEKLKSWKVKSSKLKGNNGLNKHVNLEWEVCYVNIKDLAGF